MSKGYRSPWKPSEAKAGEWMQIDAGRAIEVLGVKIKQGGTAKYPEHVTAITVQHTMTIASDPEETQWTSVMGSKPVKGKGETLTLGSKPVKGKGETFVFLSGNFSALFNEPVTARYIKITVLSWTGYPAMRAGLLIKDPSAELQSESGPTSLQQRQESVFARQLDRAAAVAAKKAKELEFEAATTEQNEKSYAAKDAAKDATAAAKEAAVYDKLTGNMIFVGVLINHSPLYPQYMIQDRCQFSHPGADASQLGRVLSGDSYDTHAESGGQGPRLANCRVVSACRIALGCYGIHMRMAK